MSREMKHSGAAWIGNIPKHWDVGRYKFCGTLEKGKLPSETNIEGKGLPIIGASEMNGKPPRQFTEEILPMCTEQDILILWDGANAGLVAHGMCGIVSSTAVVLKRDTEKLNSDYLYYQLKSNETFFRDKVNGTTIPHMNSAYLDELPPLIPPLAEQKAIADFLDKKCNEIDELVALQEKMIEELRAYKQSVITEAVCKGLNPNVPMKDSGVEWIGEIPEAWSIVKLGLLTSKIGSGSTPSGGAEVYTEDGVKFMRSQNVYFEGFDLTNVAHISQEIDEQMKSTRVYKGDILFNITGGSIGRCCDVDATLGAANVNQHVCIVRPTKILTKYLKYYLQSNSGQTQVRLLQTGGNRDGLSADAFKKFLILVPTCSEQEEIADYLDKKCSEIDQLISIKQQKIVELNDYKKSLIYEYATGKKEVKL